MADVGPASASASNTVTRIPPTKPKPKATLYCWPTSFLSTVPRLCLLEKGYPDEEYEIQHVDITCGENFSLAYLRINRFATVPTLVLPRVDSPQDSSEPAFHILHDLRRICLYIDAARAPEYPTSGPGRPVRVLSPLTAQERGLCEDLINLVRSPQVDPNFLEVTARNASELRVKLRGVQGARLRDRQLAISSHLKEGRVKAAAAEEAGNLKEARMWGEMIATLENKWQTNQRLMDIWNGTVNERRKLEYFETSRGAWTVHLPATFTKLEVNMVGPYALGDDLTIADCYIVAWLARIVAMCGGGPVPRALELVEPYMGGVRLGTRVQIYWGHWVQRGSFRRLASVLFPSME